MKKEIVLSNGNMFINFDSFMNMRDFYFPYVGMFNHLNGEASGIGVWVDDKFSWIDNRWDIKFGYEKKTLVSNVILKNQELGIELIINDAIHKYSNMFLRKIRVKNLKDKDIRFRIYFYHPFKLNETEIGNTAYFNPKLKGILHYKGNTYLFISGSGGEIDYTVSKKNHISGSWKEIEEGKLKRTKIVQGEIDSAFGLIKDIKANQEETLYYYILAGHRYDDIKKLKQKVDRETPEHLLEETILFWRSWVQEKDRLHPAISMDIKSLYYRSLLITRAHIDNRGAIIAANDTSIYKFNKDHYSYLWPRDGSFVAIALDNAGYFYITEKFFKFCADKITEDGYLLHKYSPDGSVGSSWHPWSDEEENFQLPIQEDETALVIYALYNHYKVSKNIEFIDFMYNKYVRPATEFMISYRDEKTKLPLESYDLWEEKRGIFTYTASTVYAGLNTASFLANITGNKEESIKYKKAAEEVREAILKYLYDEKEGLFVRMLRINKDGSIYKDFTAESSLLLISKFGIVPVDDYRFLNTLKYIEEKLWIKEGIGGLARYEGDYYHRVSENVAGNPWVITTLWLADVYLELGEYNKTFELINWVLKRKSESGLLAEQYDPFTGEPLSVNPLTWSHSTFCYIVQNLSKKLYQMDLEENFVRINV